MRHSDPSASITVWLRSCRLMCTAPSRCVALVLVALVLKDLLAGFHFLHNLLTNGRVVLRHLHDRGLLFHRETLVGDGLHERLVGLVHEPPLVGVAGRR